MLASVLTLWGSLGTQLRFANGDEGTSAPRDARMESPIVLDYTNGNLYFGDDSAIVYQVSQATLE